MNDYVPSPAFNPLLQSSQTCDDDELNIATAADVHFPSASANNLIASAFGEDSVSDDETLMSRSANSCISLPNLSRLTSMTKVHRRGAQALPSPVTFVSSSLAPYLVSPRLCHRFVGYLEEEAVRTYTHILEIMNSTDPADKEVADYAKSPANEIAVRYWKLSADATMLDVVLAMRADEANYRDVNHTFANMKSDHRNPFLDHTELITSHSVCVCVCVPSSYHVERWQKPESIFAREVRSNRRQHLRNPRQEMLCVQKLCFVDANNVVTRGGWGAPRQKTQWITRSIMFGAAYGWSLGHSRISPPRS
jgi:hypothetical protein